METATSRKALDGDAHPLRNVTSMWWTSPAGSGHGDWTPSAMGSPMKGPRPRWHHGPRAQPGAEGRSGRPGRAQGEAGHRERGCCPCPPLGRTPASAHREVCTAGRLAHPPPAPDRPLTHDFNFRKDDQSPPSRGSAQSSAKCPRETCGDRHSEPGAGTMGGQICSPPSRSPRTSHSPPAGSEGSWRTGFPGNGLLNQ